MAVAVMAVAAATTVYGQVSASQSRAEAERKDAALKDIQAQEILQRSAIRERELLREGEQFKGQQVVSLAALGVDVGGSSSLSLLADTNYRVNQDIINMKRESEFRARQVKAGADFQREQATGIERAGYIGAFGSVLSQGLNFYAAGGFDKKTPSKE